MNALTKFLSERGAKPGDLVVTNERLLLVRDFRSDDEDCWVAHLDEDTADWSSNCSDDPLALYRPDWHVRERDFPHIALEKIEPATPAPIDAEAVIEGADICKDGIMANATRKIIDALNAALTPLVADVAKLKEGR